jgi:hypothetical protein
MVFEIPVGQDSLRPEIIAPCVHGFFLARGERARAKHLKLGSSAQSTPIPSGLLNVHDLF